MPVPTTVVTLTSIQTEFGGANPVNLSEYYRGGTYVPSGQSTSATDGTAISTSGTIRIGMFRGLTETVSGTVLASGSDIWNASDVEYFSAASAASITVNSDGTVSRVGNESLGTMPNWFSPTTTGAGNSYWLRATATSGSPSGTLNTWIALSTNRSYSVSRATAGTTSANLTFEIATDSAGTNIIRTYTLNTVIATTSSTAPP